MTTNAAAGGTPEAPPPRPAPDFSWMRVGTQRNMRPAIGPQGLRLRDIDQGSYGYVPDHWPYRNDHPRGASPGNLAGLEAGYSLYEKWEVWSENAADLYEDAIRDRWTSAADIPWEKLEPQAEITERAFCQVLTELSEASLITLQIYSGWLERISYGFYEVKSFLATQIYDSGRHHEALRKRALANGGGLGMQSPGIFHRAVTSSLRFTELVASQNIVRDVYHLVVLEALRSVVTNDADRTLLSLVIRDLWRHVEFGVGHIDYYLKSNPTKHDQVHTWLGRPEMLLAADLQRDVPFNEAMILLLGDSVAEGRRRWEHVQDDFVAAYLHRLYAAGLYNRAERLYPDFKQRLPEGVGTPITISMEPMMPDPLRHSVTPA